ncbi:hypothetical protein C2857_000435 [Epichloe festucae Fl1]|uniref:T6SS Phospholipase effector Tle1-like catalytic domain-containing protein n=1 Tax=Epichloe festucae (strain Fl1) TaxID=877507 RepID=A0A7S9PWU4_EPIFF|nr:hypothetical protein C2857_000435 [Epichloe festucae Fl1]
MADGLLGPRSADGPGNRRDHVSSVDGSLGAASPRARSPRAMSPFLINMANKKEVERPPRKLILCFDGTGNRFHGDESDSNILKIFRMLDRSADDQYHYYQPGIGTYVISDSLSHSGLRTRIRSWYQKAKDSAIGSSFDQHVVGGYRFLMRFYQTGDEMYMFGFSRGAYIARFLAEMLDYIGLLCHGNEEMVKFAWKAFAQWQRRKPASKDDDDDDDGEEDAGEDEETRRMYNYMKGFRETFSRPVGRIRFLGLFDTVNSVPQFETAWMQRSKFPYTARSSARVIRHAVSIDERRAKFREDLMYQKAPKHQHHAHKHRHHMGEMMDRARKSMDHTHAPGRADAPEGKETHRQDFAPYRARFGCRQRMVRGALVDRGRETDNMSCSDASQWDGELEDWRDEDQDINEVWFAGGHGDIGGGWEALDDRKSASHVPLAWMVREAIKAGLAFDVANVTDMGCQDVFDNDIRRASRPAIQVQDEAGHVRDGLRDGLRDGRQNSQSSPEMEGSEVKGKRLAQETTPTSPFHDMMHRAHTSRIHDSLEYGGGLGPMAVTAWKLMEYLPFRRMDLQPDGSWKPIRWPLPCGETRDIPDDVRVHGSVLRRMKEDETYRPGNLIIGGGGRGVRRARPEDGTGDWICIAEPGDAIGEIWSKKPRGTNGTNGVGH